MGEGRIEEINDHMNNLKKGEESRTPQLDSRNRYSILTTTINS